MSKPKNQAGQPDGSKPLSKGAALKQAAPAVDAAARAHGLAGGLPWGVILPLIFKLIESLTGGGGNGGVVTARATR